MSLISEVNVYIHPSLWAGGVLLDEVKQELVDKYNAPGKIQRISTQAPMVTITTYEPE